MNEKKRFLNVQDIQNLFGIGRNKAIALMNSKGFPAIKLGRTYRVDSAELEEWIKKNKGKEVNIKTTNEKENP